MNEMRKLMEKVKTLNEGISKQEIAKVILPVLKKPEGQTMLKALVVAEYFAGDDSGMDATDNALYSLFPELMEKIAETDSYEELYDFLHEVTNKLKIVI